MNIESTHNKLITAELAWRYRVAYLKQQNGTLYLHAGKDTDPGQLRQYSEELSLITGHPVVFDLIEEGLLQQLMEQQYAKRDNADQRLQHNYYEGNPDHFLDDLIAEAKYLKSSDIHIETYETDCRVRIRVDGLLVLRYLIEKKLYPSLINKIKIAANLDIAEKRLPQDGRIFFNKGADKFDIRVSIVPALYGEKVVLR
ncbi:MAG TPA: ATPase, T2SS/T4P/T4SS family, partial [Niabella sp.]|nr:ATPase, T2SS/T4P/T4SS family [Niabella sp.]